MNKGKIPEVRMTKTARMRLLKANPLIKYELQKTNNNDLVKHLDLDSVSRLNKAIVENIEKSISISVKEEKPSKESKQKNPIPKRGSGNGNKINTKRNLQKVESSIVQKADVKKRILRRSLSAPRLQQNTGISTVNDRELDGPLNVSVSYENIPSIEVGNSFHAFKTPLDKRRSYFQPSSSRKSLIFATPSAAPELKRRLTDWLSKRNKTNSSVKHLKCFGAHSIKVISEDDKENANTSIIEENGSYENLNIDCPKDDSRFLETPLVFAPSDLERIAKEALKDLHYLISEGYPTEQCEEWLKIIRHKCRQIVEEPQYWECRATIEQLRGDIGSAVECYKTAVVHGAEVSCIEQSLDQLLQKFKVLDVDSSSTTPAKNDRKKVVQDFKNVFTSMLIKFAIQEKKLKSNSSTEHSNVLEPSKSVGSSRLIVTPVRRSTRLSRSMYASTPGVQICSSITEIDEERKSKMVFKTNEALNP